LRPTKTPKHKPHFQKGNETKPLHLGFAVTHKKRGNNKPKVYSIEGESKNLLFWWNPLQMWIQVNKKIMRIFNRGKNCWDEENEVTS